MRGSIWSTRGLSPPPPSSNVALKLNKTFILFLFFKTLKKPFRKPKVFKPFLLGFQTKNVQPPDHHYTVADSAQMMADSANGGELRRSPWRFGMADMA
ncbi:hypothetical protein ES288_A03G171200v1 [Gossypium darwinii]|uniref:Uncharacterized protein n=1 Tax=Gossypium darwinii TaxID=34276 RepID=A0A5D2H5I2_GOSDA|nr:hypothetical protein ES288_A03G171200v1 [Gossypium darwinii]